MTQDNKPQESKEENKKPQDHSGVMMTGHIKIFEVNLRLRTSKKFLKVIEKLI